MIKELNQVKEQIEIYNKKKDKVDHYETQKKINDEFKTLILEVDGYIKWLGKVHNYFQYQCLEDVVERLNQILNYENNFINDEGTETYSLDNAKRSYNTLKSKEKGNWKKQYKSLFENTINILNLIEKLGYKKASEIVRDIKSAEIWSQDSKQLNILKNAIDQSNELINSLKLDNEIKVFLQKVNDQKATLLDLNDVILDWIKSENLAAKIKLNFL